MNNVNLVGRLTKDPDYQQSNNTVFVRFTVAAQRKYKNADGNYDSDFISCVAYANTADFVHKYFHKGNRIGVTGEIRTGSYVKNDGTKVYTTDVLANSVEFVESSGNSGNSGGGNGGNKAQAAPPEEEKLPF